jgi:hypothetical protein
MKSIKLISLNYFKKESEITGGIAIKEGIIAKFEREDKSIYEREYSITKTPFDIPSITEKLNRKFILDLIQLYHMFVSEKTPTIKKETCSKFCKDYISFFTFSPFPTTPKIIPNNNFYY